MEDRQARWAGRVLRWSAATLAGRVDRAAAEVAGFLDAERALVLATHRRPWRGVPRPALEFEHALQQLPTFGGLEVGRELAAQTRSH
jgi:hypothetical protein